MPARVVLYILSFTGFLVSFMMRTDINLAIVVMARMPPRNLSSSSDEPLYCYTNQVDEQNETSVPDNEQGEFDWDSTTQSTILSSFYWCYIISQV